MNGLFVGTNHGLYFVEPEKEPICEIELESIEYIDSNESGLAAAIVKNNSVPKIKKLFSSIGHTLFY